MWGGLTDHVSDANLSEEIKSILHMVVGFIVDEILRVGFKNDKVTRARNIGQGH